MAEDEKKEDDGDKKKAKDNAADDQPAKPKKSFKKRLVKCILLIAGLVFWQTSIIVLVGMLPTVLAAMLDRSPGRSASLTVGAMNLAGVMPIVLMFWQQAPTSERIVEMLMFPTHLLIMYGAAFAGWVLYDNITPFVAIGVRRKTEYRIRDIEKRQAQLRDLWGDAVTGDPS